MPRKATATESPASPRRWRYLDETPRVLTTVRHVSGSTLLAYPGGVYELHPDHTGDADFDHPLLEATDDPAFDPAPPAPEPASTEPAGEDQDEQTPPLIPEQTAAGDPGADQES